MIYYKNILIIGDSLTGNYSIGYEKPWTELIKENSDNSIKTITMNGALTSSILGKLCEEISKSSVYDCVWFMGGTNDAFSHMKYEDIFSTINEAVRILLKKNIASSVLIPPGINKEKTHETFGDPMTLLTETEKTLVDLQDIIHRKFSGTENVRIIDFRDFRSEYPGFKDEIYTDGIHFSVKFHRYISQRLTGMI